MELRATLIRGLAGAEATADGEAVVIGMIDAKGRSSLLALPRLLVLDLIGYLTMAWKQASERSCPSGQQSVAVVVEKFQVAGSDSRRVALMLLQIASGSSLEFALTPKQAADLSRRLAAMAARLQATKPTTH